jgi:hypothetical protein
MIIELEGGLIQSVRADFDCDVIIRDLDTEGSFDERCPPLDETYVESFIHREHDDAWDDPDHVGEFDALWAHLDGWLDKHGG